MTIDEETGEVQEARAFSVFLHKLGDGEAHAQLSEELHNLSKHAFNLARDTQKKTKATMNLKVSFEYDPNGICGITYEIKTTLPKKPTVSTVMFVDIRDPNRRLLPHNPRQQSLPLREIDGGQRPAVELEAPNAAPREI